MIWEGRLLIRPGQCRPGVLNLRPLRGGLTPLDNGAGPASRRARAPVLWQTISNTSPLVRIIIGGHKHRLQGPIFKGQLIAVPETC